MNTQLDEVQQTLTKAHAQWHGGQPDDAFNTLIEAVRNAAPNPVRDARATIAEHFAHDPDFRRTYEANIAMLLCDKYGLKADSKAAHDILKMIFEV